MAAYDRVMVEIAAGIGTVTLNRPEKLNAFDAVQCQELHEALRMLAGSGANLALACDYRIASDQASIGQVFHKLGLVPDWGGSFFLPRLVGTSRALELVWSARMVSAVEALVLGLFDRVVPHAQLATEARRLAELWAGQPPGAVRRAKEALYASEVRSLAAMLDWEIAQQNELFASPEARERLAGGASLAKRSR